ncbi:CDP-alcohol phosphatidyltransferase family protein [Marinobacter bohaiensis]|uniref:CDP-alcohol phosphatidyltransferase family protein n=1 Tax=Marinobacter bohaiensis TaxID=2201898 RepID=UPI000DAC8F29|nr:CDP-alcohol phosphatidyltransferase family protein [Marinobacter bohaiensis]
MDVLRPGRLNGRIMTELLAAVALTGVVGIGLGYALHLPAVFPALATGAAGLLAIVVGHCWHRHPESHGMAGHESLGPANRVTLTRGTLICLIAAFLPLTSITPAQSWTLAWLCFVALVMDGVDGATARRTGSHSRFGARFDMELDSALMLLLCALAVSLDKAGSWVLLIGLARYLFLLAGRAQPKLQQPLPDSFRRKTICVWQLVTLLLVLLPPFPAALAAPALALSLVLLVYSFGRDVVWLLRQPDGATHSGGRSTCDP